VVVGRSTRSLVVMTIPYAWRCKFCGVQNDAGTEACATCGRPAIARAVDVDRVLGDARPPRHPENRLLAVVVFCASYASILAACAGIFFMDIDILVRGIVALVFLGLVAGLHAVALGFGLGVFFTRRRFSLLRSGLFGVACGLGVVAISYLILTKLTAPDAELATNIAFAGAVIVSAVLSRLAVVNGKADKNDA
jgi:hypothetical protein